MDEAESEPKVNLEQISLAILLFLHAEEPLSAIAAQEEAYVALVLVGSTPSALDSDLDMIVALHVGFCLTTQLSMLMMLNIPSSLDRLIQKATDVHARQSATLFCYLIARQVYLSVGKLSLSTALG